MRSSGWSTMVGEHRLSAVIGPSGSGKSSLTLAGLLPALHGGAVPGSETWISVRAVPGGYPFDELATALGALSTESLSALATELAAEDGKGLLRVAKRIGQELDGELVIVIDQFEELFTLVADDDVRNAFATALVTAATDPLEQGPDRAHPSGRLLPPGAHPALARPDHQSGPSRLSPPSTPTGSVWRSSSRPPGPASSSSRGSPKGSSPISTDQPGSLPLAPVHPRPSGGGRPPTD